MDGVVKCTLVAAMIVGVLSSGPVRAEDITRGAVTGQTTAKGYDHPGQYLHVPPTKIAENMEPVMVHAEQDKGARQKLADFGEEVRQETQHTHLYHG